MMVRVGQAAMEEPSKPGEQPKGSRTKPVVFETKPDTGSRTLAVTARVVAGSRTVPTGINRPKASSLGAADDWPVIRSWKLVKPLARSASVGTEPVRIVP